MCLIFKIHLDSKTVFNHLSCIGKVLKNYRKISCYNFWQVPCICLALAVYMFGSCQKLQNMFDQYFKHNFYGSVSASAVWFLLIIVYRKVLIMEANSKNSIIVMNFTGAYMMEDFAGNPHFIHLDCTHIIGTDCFCSLEGEKRIKNLIAPFGPEGIHFIDSGDYHYITKFWTDKIKYPFSLVLFDHHTDMQVSQIKDMLSCGNWVLDMMENNSFLQHVILFGVPENKEEDIRKAYPDKVRVYDVEEMQRMQSSVHLFSMKEPVYISIDKDVLNTEAAETNWDQGTLSMKSLQKALYLFLNKEKVIGIDICGEYSMMQDLFDERRGAVIDNAANASLLSVIRNSKRKE